MCPADATCGAVSLGGFSGLIAELSLACRSAWCGGPRPCLRVFFPHSALQVGFEALRFSLAPEPAEAPGVGAAGRFSPWGLGVGGVGRSPLHLVAAVPCLPGPALVHPECAQAGQRPALLQTLQRQPAPRHREALGALRAAAACSLRPAHCLRDTGCCPRTTSTFCRRCLPDRPGHPPESHALSHAAWIQGPS